MTEPGRRHPARAPVFETGQRSTIIFLTVCTAAKKPILATPEAMKILLMAWQAADHWLVGRYVVLPDHLHLFCSPARPESLGIKVWLKYWKSIASNSWPQPDAHPVWQIDGWDTQLRRDENYDKKWEYVRENPIRHGLVSAPEDWHFQRALNFLPWHDT